MPEPMSAPALLGEKAPAAPGTLSELLKVAVPLVVSSGSLSLMTICDRVFLTWYSPDALAAALPAALVHYLLLSIPLGLGLYVNAFVAQYEGANRPERVVAAVWQGIYMALAASIPIGAAALLARPLFSMIGHDGRVQPLEVDYFQTLCFGSAAMLLATVISCFYSGRGQTRVVMWIHLAAMIANIAVDATLIFGLGPFPELGIRGAALATVTAYTLAAVLFGLGLFRSTSTGRYRQGRSWLPDRTLLRRMLRYGFPNGLQALVDIGGFSIFLLLLGRSGRTELAATNLAFNLNALAFVPMLGIGTAVTTLVGLRIGSGRPQLAVRTTWIAFALCAGYMAPFAMLYVTVPDVLMLPYAWFSDPASFEPIRAHVAILLRFVAAYCLFDAMVIVFGSAVRGAGDTRFALLHSLACVTLLLVLPCVVIACYFDAQLLLNWTVCTVYIAVLGIGFLLRFLQGRWRQMRVIEPTAATAETVEAPSPASESILHPIEETDGPVVQPSTVTGVGP